MRYVLGVDGGNTKTDYILCDESGRAASYVRAGTCSRENLGYDGAKVEMQKQLILLLQKAHASLSDIAYAAMGLAGVDNEEHRQKMTSLMLEIGLSRVMIANDSFLGIKAGSDAGVGICSINGTEMSTGGIDSTGKMLQVGGLRAYSGDDAGGIRIAEAALAACYDRVYRFGENTCMLSPILQLFDCAPDNFHSAIGEKYLKTVSTLDVIKVLFAASDAGDSVARAIITHAADTLAKNAAGCALRLSLPRPVPIVLAGSVWTKGQQKLMIDFFKKQFTAYSGLPCVLYSLSQPPVSGAVLWAYELAQIPVDRERVLENVQHAEP